MKVVTFDFETVDHGLAEKLGSGWPWGGVTFIGCGLKVNDEPSYYSDDEEHVREVLESADLVIAHNAQYEAGIMKMWGFDMRKVRIHCTKLMAQFYRNTIRNTSLDALAKLLLNDNKYTEGMIDAALEKGILRAPDIYAHPSQLTKELVKNLRALTESSGKRRPTEKAIIDNCKRTYSKLKNDLFSRNLAVLQNMSSSVADYCIQDVDVTKRLYDVLAQNIDMEVYERFAPLINVCVDIRARGVRIDRNELARLKNDLVLALAKAEADFFAHGDPINYGSAPQVAAWAKRYGLQPVEQVEPDGTIKAKYDKAFVAKYSDEYPMVKDFGQCKRLSKLLSMVEGIYKAEKFGRIHSELVPFGARTGRFASRNPNLQQVPKRDPEWGKRIRAVFLPEEGDKWISIDYASQEPRLAVHYAYALHTANRIKAQTAVELADKYNAGLEVDFHSENMELVNRSSSTKITRQEAKAVGLGRLYGAGYKKIALQLGIPEAEGKSIFHAFNTAAPHITQLSKYVEKVMEKNGRVKTLAGRHVRVDSGFEYKSLNALIQGSALDQSALALVEGWKAGLTILGMVHDSIEVSGQDADGQIMKDIMEAVTPLKIPVEGDMTAGDNWGSV